MSKLSKYYKVTNQIMVEFLSDQYSLATKREDEIDAEQTEYIIYQGLDQELYYIEKPIHSDVTDNLYYSDMQYFVKFPDNSDSEYKYLGLIKKAQNNYTIYDNTEKLTSIFNKDNPDTNYILSCSDIYNEKIYHDKIRIHLIYGFMLDDLAGFTLQLKTNARALQPKQVINGYNRYVTDEEGNPVFETVNAINKNTGLQEQLEELVNDTIDFTFLDYYFPKEFFILNNVIKYHKVPIYQNGAFYDRYIDITVPSIYFMQLFNKPLKIQSVYGSTYNVENNHYIQYQNDNYVSYYINDTIYKLPMFKDPKYKNWYMSGRYDLLPYYAIPASQISDRQLILTVLQDPEVIINFATVKEENSKQNSTVLSSYLAEQTFLQDPINQIAFKYKNNSDLFNIRIFEDEESAEVVYYPVFGIGDNVVELNYEIMSRIESGEIPMITESFLDRMQNDDTFTTQYGENAFKWIIFNDLYIEYIYINPLNSVDDTELKKYVQTRHFTNITDYGIQNPEEAGAFWKNTFIPRVKPKANMMCSGIIIQYTCRLINRLSNVEAIRTATLRIKDVNKYMTRRITLNNVNTYKIVNQIKKNEIRVENSQKEENTKLIRSYYDVTNLVVRDMNNTNLYTQGQMTLQLKHTSHNYMFRLYTLNENNARIPYDLTGPYRYKLIFPTTSSLKIEIYPNTENSNLDYNIGQLVFYITEDQVKQIMRVPYDERYFAIVTDVQNSEQQQSTLYEGKVQYL